MRCGIYFTPLVCIKIYPHPTWAVIINIFRRRHMSCE